VAYHISENNLERQRLLARTLEPLTSDLLQKVGFSKGSHCLDLGCGIGITTMLLHKMNGGIGLTVGVDQDPVLVDVAGQEYADAILESKLQFIRGDATDLEFEDESFDVVFARYLLVHLADPAVALREMVRVCKRGGFIIIQEPDLTIGYLCEPPNWAFDKMFILTNLLFPDGRIGRKLPRLLQEMGHKWVHVQAQSAVTYPDNDILRLWSLTGTAISPALVAKEILTQDEADSLCTELQSLEQQKGVLAVSNLIFSTWFTKS
jgi:SAM-dependent methyltransferase